MAIGEFIKETRAELKHVVWPTRNQAIAYAALVIAISLGLGLFLGFFDYLFSTGLHFLVTKF